MAVGQPYHLLTFLQEGQTFCRAFFTLWMADEVVGVIGMEGKSLSACDKASSTLAFNAACSSFLCFQKVYSFS